MILQRRFERIIRDEEKQLANARLAERSGCGRRMNHRAENSALTALAKFRLHPSRVGRADVAILIGAVKVMPTQLCRDEA
jgi:hypothetical protein